SDAVYPFQDSEVTESSCDGPMDLYGAMHRARELMFRATAECPLAIVRPTLVYGEGDPHNAYGVMRMLRSASAQGEIVLFGNGEETRDHILVDDVVALTIGILERRSYGVVNAATGSSISYRDLADLVVGRIPHPVRIRLAPRAQPITHRRFGTLARTRAFPEIEMTPLREGIARSQA
ncbi:MAG: NAD-dependent epimerase/dehydratase family protein, partial [Myxococcota bacterium]